jgi:hypothetical protein
MDGERKDEYKKNAAKWMQKAKEAMQEGGCSILLNFLQSISKFEVRTHAILLQDNKWVVILVLEIFRDGKDLCVFLLKQRGKGGIINNFFVWIYVQPRT